MFKLATIPGGVHPAEGKTATAALPIQTAPLLESYMVPLLQHLGKPSRLMVQKDHLVRKGQLLAEPADFISAAIHAPTSGKVKAITECPGPAGVRTPAIEIAADGRDEADLSLKPLPDWESQPTEVLLNRIRDAGVVGMGGAAFPTHVKLSPPPARKIDILILNGVECEPFLTADDRLLLEQPEKIIAGARIAARILGAKTILLGIEENKPAAIALMQQHCSGGPVQVVPLPVRYPQGAEKQLIYALTRRRVPAGGLPLDIGCVVHNVGTLAAISDAVLAGRPVIERVTTVTGSCVIRPGNWLLRIGTPLREVLKLVGGVSRDPAKILFGGPMMGLSQHSLEVPVMKSTSGILLLAPEEITQFTAEACIRCGACLDACPMDLNPSDLSLQIENERFDLAEKTFAMDCMECGCCAYICPAHRPLVQHLKRAKAEIAARRRTAAAARK